MIIQTSLTHRRDLGGKLNGLGDAQDAFFNGTLEVDILNLLAEVRLRADKADEAVLDLQQHVGALLDGLLDGARSLDDELLATVTPC